MNSDEERRDTDSEEVKRDISKEIEKMWVYKNTGIEDNNKKVSTGRTYADVLRENKKTIFKKSERGTKYSTGSSATMVKVMAQEGSKYLPTDYSETNLMYHLHHSKVIHSLDVKTIKYNLKNNWVTMKVTKTQEITKNTLDVFKRGEIQNISSKNVLWWVEEIVPNTWVTISGVPLGAAPDEVKQKEVPLFSCFLKENNENLVEAIPMGAGFVWKLKFAIPEPPPTPLPMGKYS